MNQNTFKPVGCAEMYYGKSHPIEYMMYLENEDTFVQLQSTEFFNAHTM